MSKLLISEPPLQVSPSLAATIGLNEAIFVQQLHYWLKSTKHHRDGKPWVYNTVAEWAEQFPFWSAPTIRRIINSLREMGIVEVTSEYNKMPIDKTLWYTIDYSMIPNDQIDHSNDEIVTPCDQIDHMERSDCANVNDQVDHTNNQRLPETTTETTAESVGESDPLRAPPPAPPGNSPHTHDSRRDIFVEELPVASHRNAAAVYGAIDQPEPQDKAAREAMFRALCKAAGMDGRTLKPHELNQIADTSHILHKAGYVSADVERFMRDIWFNDWRWEKNRSRPTLNQIRQEIGKLHAERPSESPIYKQSETDRRIDSVVAMMKAQGVTYGQH